VFFSRKKWLSLYVEVFLLASSSFSVAQISRVAGALQGIVVDQTGGVIPGARTTLRHQETGQTRTAVTGAEGTFRIGELQPGPYALRVESPGFSSYLNNAIMISIGAVVPLRIQLAPAGLQQQITVSEEPPAIDPTQTAVATTVGEDRIEESPVVTRRYLDFALLAPGLNSSNIQVSSSATAALPNSGFTFAGLRTRSNSLYIDGVENNDEFTGSTRTELSLETIKEFQVINNGLSAESGGSAGGTINVITKRGANIVHGDAFLFVQNGVLNAKDPLTNETSKPELRRYRTGLSAGGPIIRDRTFYYFAGEQESSRGDDSSLISPSAGDAINAALNSGALPGIAVRSINPALFRVAHAETEASARLDHQIGPRNSLLLKYALTNSREAGDAFNTGGLIDPSGRGSSFIEDKGVTGSLISVLGQSALNNFRFQVSSRRDVSRTTDQIGPEIVIAGLVDFGRPYAGNSRRHEDHYQFVDVTSVSRAQHWITFGVDTDLIHENVSAGDGFGAVYTFPNLDSFLNRQPDQYRQAFGDPETRFSPVKYAGFLQDHWTISSRFTLDAGLRYDFEHLPGGFHQAPYDLAPRFGIAYSPVPKWVLRAGFGMFYDRYLLAALNRAFDKNGAQAFEQVADGSLAPEIFNSQLGASARSPNLSIRPSIFTAEANLPSSYSEIVTATAERQLTNNLTVSATVLFARGVKLSRTRNVNLPTPVLLTAANASSLGISQPYPQALGRTVFPSSRLSPQFDDIYQWENRADSTYRGLSLALNRRLAKDVEFSGSYTLSKATDDASDFDEQPQNPYATMAERAPSSNDQRHRFVFSGTFDLPFGDEADGNKASGVMQDIFGNIEAAPILTIGSGRPVDPLTGFDANRNHAYPFSSRPLGFARNSLATPAQAQVDLRILKFFNIGERGKLDLVAESFNLFNHRNVAALNQFYGPGLTQLSTFATPNRAGIPRQLQFSIDFEF